MLKKIKSKLFAEGTTEYYLNTSHKRYERPPPKRKKSFFKNLLKHKLSRFKGRRVSAVRKFCNNENQKHVYPNKQILTIALKEGTRDDTYFVKLYPRVNLYKSMDFKMFITSLFVFNVIRDMVSRMFILMCARDSPLKIKEKFKILSFENTKSKYTHIFDFNYKSCQQYLVYTVHVYYPSQGATTPTRKATSRPPQPVPHTQRWTHNEMKGTYLRQPHGTKNQIEVRKVPSNKSGAPQLYKNITIFEQAGDFRNINQASDEASTSRLDEKKKNFTGFHNQICWLSSTTLTTESSSSRMNFCRKISELENSKKGYDSTPISNNKSKTLLAARNLIARVTKHRRNTTPECTHISMQMDIDPENTTKGKVVGMQWQCNNNASKNTELLKQEIEAISEKVDYSRPKSLNSIKKFLQNKRKQLKRQSTLGLKNSPVESEPNTQPIIDSSHKITHIQQSPTTILQTPNPVDRCKLAELGSQDYHHTRTIEKLRPNKVNLGTLKNISEQRNSKRSTLTMQGFYLNIPPATSKRTINTINNQSKIQREETETMAKTLSKKINLTVCNIPEEFPTINNEKPKLMDTSIIDMHSSENTYPSLLPNYSSTQTVAFTNTWSSKFPSTDASRSTISDLSEPRNKHAKAMDGRFKKIEQSLGLLNINPNILTEPVLNIVTDSNGSRRMVLDIELGTSSNKLAERFLGKPNLEHPSSISKAQVVRAGCKTHKNIYLEEVKSAGLLSIDSNKSSDLLNINNQTETEVLWTGIINDSKNFEKLPLTESNTSKEECSKRSTQKPLHYLHQSVLRPLLSEHQLRLKVSSRDLISQRNTKQYLLRDPPPLLKTIVSADAIEKLSGKIWWKPKRLRKPKAISMKKERPRKWDDVLDKALLNLENKCDTRYEIAIPISEVKSVWDSLDDELKLKIIESKEEEKWMLIEKLKKLRERSMSKGEKIFDKEEKWSRSVQELEMKIYATLEEKQAETCNVERKFKRLKAKTNKATMMIKKENSCKELQWGTDQYSNAKSSESSCSAINTPSRVRRKQLSRFSKFNTIQKRSQQNFKSEPNTFLQIPTITCLHAKFSTEPQYSADISEISVCTYSDMLIGSETEQSTAGSVMVSPSINVKATNENDKLSVFHYSERLRNDASTQTYIERTSLFFGFRSFKRGYTSYSKLRKGVYFRPRPRLCSCKNITTQIRKKERTIKHKDNQLSGPATFNKIPKKSSVSSNNSKSSVTSDLHRLASNTPLEVIGSVKQKKQSSLNYKPVEEEVEVATKDKGIQSPRASNQSFQDQISKRSCVSSKNSRISERISTVEDMVSVKQNKQSSLNYKPMEEEVEVATKAKGIQSPRASNQSFQDQISKRSFVSSKNSRTSERISAVEDMGSVKQNKQSSLNYKPMEEEVEVATKAKGIQSPKASNQSFQDQISKRSFVNSKNSRTSERISTLQDMGSVNQKKQSALNYKPVEEEVEVATKAKGIQSPRASNQSFQDQISKRSFVNSKNSRTSERISTLQDMGSVKQKKQSSLNYKTVEEEAEVTTKAKGIQSPRASNQSFQDQISKRSCVSSKNSRTSERISTLEDMDSAKQKKQSSLNYKPVEEEVEVATKAKGIQSPRASNQSFQEQISKRSIVSSKNSGTSERISTLEDMGSAKQKKQSSLNYKTVEEEAEVTTKAKGIQSPRASNQSFQDQISKKSCVSSKNSRTSEKISTLEEMGSVKQGQQSSLNYISLENETEEATKQRTTSDLPEQQNENSSRSIKSMENEIVLEPTESLILEQHEVDIPRSNTIKNTEPSPATEYETQAQLCCNKYRMYGVSMEDLESLFKKYIQSQSLHTKDESNVNILQELEEFKKTVTEIHGSSQPEQSIVSDNIQEKSNKSSVKKIELIQNIPPSKSESSGAVESMPRSSVSSVISYSSLQSIPNKLSQEYTQTRKPSKSKKNSSDSVQSNISTKFTQNIDSIQVIKPSKSLGKISVSDQSIPSAKSSENDIEPIQTSKPSKSPSKSFSENNTDFVQTKNPSSKLATNQTIESTNYPAINFCAVQNQLSSKYPQMDEDSLQSRKLSKLPDSVQNIQSSNSQQRCVQTRKSIKSSAKSSCSTQIVSQTFFQAVDSSQVIKPSKSPEKSSGSVQSIESKKSPQKHIKTRKLSKSPVKSFDSVQFTKSSQKDTDSIQTGKLSKFPAKNSDSIQVLSSILLSSNSPQKVVQTKKWSKSPPKDVASILRMLSKKIPKEDTDSVQTRQPRGCPEECSGSVQSKKSSKPQAECSDSIQNMRSSKSPQSDISHVQTRKPSVSPENSLRSIKGNSPRNDMNSVQATKQSKPLAKSSDSVQNVLTRKHHQKRTDSNETRKPSKSPQKGHEIRNRSKPPAEIIDSHIVPRKSPERVIHTGKSRKSKKRTSPCNSSCKFVLEIEGNKILLANDCFRKEVQIQDTASINIEIKGKDEKLNFSTPDVKYSYSTNIKN